MRQAPCGIHLLACAGIELGIQCTCGIALIFLGILVGRVKLFIFRGSRSSTQQGGAVCEGWLVKVQFLELLLHEELVSSSSHASLSGQPLGCNWLSIYGWCHCYGIQMSDSLFSSLMGELPSHLYFVASLLESLLEGYHFYHVASPWVYAHQLVGLTK